MLVVATNGWGAVVPAAPHTCSTSSVSSRLLEPTAEPLAADRAGTRPTAPRRPDRDA
jgi:hypothetical protein